MTIRYESAAAHKLVDDINNNNKYIESIGDSLIKIKKNFGWNDNQFKNLEMVINKSLFSVGVIIKNQNDYMSKLKEAIERLER